jgi:hypothetical protein
MIEMLVKSSRKKKCLCCESPAGAVAQLGERLLCKQEVTGSIPVSSNLNLTEVFYRSYRFSGRDCVFRSAAWERTRLETVVSFNFV